MQISGGLRALAFALALACAAPRVAVAQVADDPAAKAKRVETYQDRLLIYEPASSAKPYSLRQGPDPIYDADFVALMRDPSLTGFFERERLKDYAWWLGTGAVGVPLGGLVFAQNFRADGPLAPFGNDGRPAAAQADDWRSFALSIGGAALASYGAYTLGLWLAETLDWRHPNRLDDDSIAPRVKAFNAELAERLALAPADIPSAPPTPRPSPSPSPTPTPGTQPWLSFPVPGAPNAGPGDYATGDAPAAVPPPTPLPVPASDLYTPAPVPTATSGLPTPPPGSPRPLSASPSPLPAGAPSPSPAGR